MWRCRETGCRVSLTTTSDGMVVKRSNNLHSHPEKCPSWDMGRQTQLRGVKIVSIMRVSIMGLNRHYTVHRK